MLPSLVLAFCTFVTAFSDTLPPLSFLYDGLPAAEAMQTWVQRKESRSLGDGRTELRHTFTDPRTGLIVTAIRTTFAKYPATEWVIRFRNGSGHPTPVIEAIRTVDAEILHAKEGSYVLHRARGSDALRNDFAPIDQPLEEEAAISFGPDVGRSSDGAAFPFFNIAGPECGVVVGIGWTGQWHAIVRRTSGHSVRLSAGMARTRLRLLPGEEIRTPSVLLLPWQGKDRMAGHNLLRRFILAYHTPRVDGKPATLPIAASLGAGGPRPCVEHCCATESFAIAMAHRFAQFGLHPEVGWIDAGWYEGTERNWWQGVGTWLPDRERFPRGLRPVSNVLEKYGMGLLVWFEPERVYEGTWLDREHPEWLIRLPGSPHRILYLGNPEARKWITDHVSGLLEREGVAIYRQDFNFIDPLPYWRAIEDTDRVGIAEIRHIEGLYAFWDSLRARRPGLIIDNCSGGGRRIDLETISRSFPLWRTDYSYFEPTGYQCHTYGLSFYLPRSGTGNNNPDRYPFRSSTGSAVVLNWDINQNSFDLQAALRSTEEFKRLRPYFDGEYYPLTDYSVRDTVWMAYQFHRPETNDGLALAFRRPAARSESIRLKLRGLLPGAGYRLTFVDYGITMEKTGGELLDGIDVTIPQAPGSLLLMYSRRDR